MLPSTAKFYLPILHLNRKDKNKEKEARNGPSLKNPLKDADRCSGGSFGAVNEVGLLEKLMTTFASYKSYV